MSNDKALIKVQCMKYPLIKCVKPLHIPLKMLTMERFIKLFILLKNSEGVCHALHFDKLFLRVDKIAKAIIFNIHIHL